MPAAGDSDYFDVAVAFSATVNERDENAVDPTSAYIRYGGFFWAGYMSFGTPDVVGEPSIKPGDRTMDGLAVTEATLTYWAYRASSGTMPGLLYPLTQSVDPADVFWLNLKDHIGERIDTITANSTTPHRETNAFVSEETNQMTAEEWAGRFVMGAKNGLLFRGNYGSTVQNQKYVDIINERGAASQRPSIRFRAALVLPYPDELAPKNGYVNPAAAARLTWKFAYDPTNVWGVLRQNGATVEVKENGVTTTYTATGETQEVVIPANTFTHPFEWRVKVTSEHGVDSLWSEWCPVTIVDSLSTAEAIRPINAFVDASAAVLFQWRHIINTGTAPTGYQLEYKQQSDANWTALASGTSSAQECTVAGSDLPSGTLYWRVRTSNADNAWGTWSEPAAVIVQAPPATPSISAITGTTIPTITWQASGQQGYEVSVDGETSGTVYGTAKSYRWPQVLADGAHTVGVRVINEFSLWSEWAYGTFTAQNNAGDPLELTAAAEEYGVALYWTDGSTVEVWRDGKRIATASNSPYVDYTAAGTHQYFLRRMGVPEWAPMGQATWQQGTIRTADGTNNTSTTVIRTSNFIFIPSNKIKLSAGDNFMFGLRLYDTQSISSFTGGDTIWNTTEKEYDVTPRTYVRYVMRYLESGTILPAEGENLTAEYERINQDYYTNSNTVTVTMTTQDAAIAVDGVWDWLPLIWTEGDLPQIQTTRTPTLALVQYSGRELPAAEVSRHQTRGHDFAYALEDQADAQKLADMLGKLVWFRFGDRIIRGILTSISENSLWWGYNESLHIEEVSTVADS